jgi:hypothetical protein
VEVELEVREGSHGDPSGVRHLGGLQVVLEEDETRGSVDHSGYKQRAVVLPMSEEVS